MRLDPSLAAGLRDGLQDLADDLDGDNEHVVSAFLPNVLAVRAMQRLGISNPTLEQQLPDLVRRALERLALRQHGDGGWGWWGMMRAGSGIEPPYQRVCGAWVGAGESGGLRCRCWYVAAR